MGKHHSTVLVFLMALLCSAAGAVAAAEADWHSGRGLRGFNLGAKTQPALADKDFAELAAYGANVVRVSIDAPLSASGNRFEIAASEWAHLDRVVAMGRKHGFKVIPTLVPIPWGEDAVFWDRPELRASLVHIWAQVAAKFKGNSSIAGYDLLNEPVRPRDRNKPQGPAQAPAGAERSTGKQDTNANDWHELAVAMTRAIRAEDPASSIIFEPSPWGLPKGFNDLAPLPFSGVVYSFHFYEPHALTHQGLHNHQGAISYPNATTSRTELSRALEPVRAFARRHGVPVLVGEFSIVRWAPGDSSARYLSDVLDLFEAEGWSWTYHSFREYEGWDAELDPALPRGTKAGRPSHAKAIGLLKEKGSMKNPRPVSER